MKEPRILPPGWDEARVQAVLEHYEAQTDEEAAAEDEAALEIRARDETNDPNVEDPDGS